jgi:glucosamine-phosphate N-acetyltransferase
MADQEGLFSSDLISPAVTEALPEGYRARSLRASDYEAGFLDCLRVLTTVGEINKGAFDERFRWLKGQDSYYIIVIEDGSTGKIVGTGALIVEKKL